MYLGKLYSKRERVFALRDMPGNPDTEATITVRLLQPGERRAADEERVRATLDADEAGQLTQNVDVNNLRRNRAIYKKAVIGWTGIYSDDKGEAALEFSPANKKVLLDMVPELADFAADCHARLVEEFEANQEAESKNS